MDRGADTRYLPLEAKNKKLHDAAKLGHERRARQANMMSAFEEEESDKEIIAMSTKWLRASSSISLFCGAASPVTN